MQKKGVIVVLVIIILLGIIYYLGFTKQGEEVMDIFLGEEDIKEANNAQQIPSFPEEPQKPIQEMPAQIIEGKIALIEINGTKFNPDEINITVGTNVTWINTDPRRAYDVYERADNQKFNSFRIGVGENFSYMFDETGTYYFSDAIFKFMKGTIRVTNE